MLHFRAPIIQDQSCCAIHHFYLHCCLCSEHDDFWRRAVSLQHDKPVHWFCRGSAENTMANWLNAVGFWEGQVLRRIFTAWRAQGGQKFLTALAHWESCQSGLGPAFRWWHHVVRHLHDADCTAQQHRQQHACRAAFQARPLCKAPPLCVPSTSVGISQISSINCSN